MSEKNNAGFINEAEDTEKIVTSLSEYIRGLLAGRTDRDWYEQYRLPISQVTPRTAFTVFTRLYQDGQPAGELLRVLEKVMHVFAPHLEAYDWQHPDADSFPGRLRSENQALVQQLADIKTQLKRRPDHLSGRLAESIRALAAIEAHYQKKENILFPYLEKKQPHFHGVALMWALHDQVRSQFRLMEAILGEEKPDRKHFNQALGRLFFLLYGLVQKEELILFPAAMDVISGEEWQAMLQDSAEFAWAFIHPPEFSGRENNRYKQVSQGSGNQAAAGDWLYQSESGRLSTELLTMIFRHLPVDITVVDEQNQVCYFSQSEKRIFPRSPAIIGRQVENCHPPASLSAVMEILDAFRNGRQNQARFWIRHQDRLILIQYFALCDQEGNYRGTMEVSQDISDLHDLKGERRLLTWSEDNS